MAHLLDGRLVEPLEAWVLTMNQETLPAFLIAGMTPRDIEALHHEAGMPPQQHRSDCRDSVKSREVTWCGRAEHIPAIRQLLARFFVI